MTSVHPGPVCASMLPSRCSKARSTARRSGSRQVDPRLAEAADLMRLTPWGLSTAAQLHRSGIRPGKR